MDLAVSMNHRVKIKENGTRDKYLDLIRESKKMSNVKVTVIPIITGTLKTVPKRFVKGLEEWESGEHAETIQTIALQRSVKIIRSVQ